LVYYLTFARPVKENQGLIGAIDFIAAILWQTGTTCLPGDIE